MGSTSAVGDGALGFWTTLRNIFPKTREQRCWVHKIANVLNKLPKSQQPKAKSSLHAMMNAATKAECERLMAIFATDYEAKYPKAVKSLQTEADKLTTHFHFPAEHWKHLRTTNPIESTFATVKLRQRVTKGAGSRKAGLAMAYRLLLLAEANWRRLNGHQLLPLVRSGVQFVDGVRIERDNVSSKANAIKLKKNTKTHPNKVAA
jgi:putative transposase